jgi:Inner membrane component of T3SS, cytoplasmic domain/von Willebrand factor type A domain
MRRLVPVLLALLIAAPPARADLKVKGQPLLQMPNQGKLKEATEVIQVPKLTVKVGAEASGLKLADFQIKSTEDPPVTYPATRMTPFKDSEEPLAMIILIDGKVRFIGDPTPEPIPGEEPQPIPGAWEEVKAAIDILAKTRVKKTKIALWVYAADVQTKAELGDPSNVGGEMLGAQKDFAKNATSALRLGLESAQSTLSSEEGRRVVILIGDGRDTSDDVNYKDIAAKFEAASIEFYAILASPKAVEPSAKSKLDALGKRVGGIIHKAEPLNTLPQIAENLVANLNNVYTVEFPLAKAEDGTLFPFDGNEHSLALVAKKEEGTLDITLPKWTWPEQPDPPAPFPWLWVILGGVVLLALIVAAVVLLKKGDDEEMEEEEEEAPAPAPAPVAAPAAPVGGPQKTMAFNVGAGGDSTPIVGWVVPLNGANAFQTFRLSSSNKSVIGTAADAAVKVEDPYMSGAHAEIVCESGNFRLLDRGSTNGIKVNDKKVASHELLDNDIFTCGQTNFKFKSIN